MKRFYYNNLFRARIKSIAFGVIGTVPTVLVLYLIGEGKIGGTFAEFSLLLPFYALMFIIARVPSGHLIEKTDSNTYLSYFRFGPFKFHPKVVAGPLKIVVEQGKDRYYLLKLIGPKTSMILERHPTLSQIQKYAEALKQLLTE
jgi:hypothetical protein